MKIYLAGPDVFLANAVEVGRRKQALCRRHGFEGLYPLEEGSAADGDARGIFRANRERMDRADLGLFNLTPFRGPSADAGTVFELGYMFAAGKPVHGYAATPQPYRARVSAACGPLRRDGPVELDREGYVVEDFGLMDNLMIARAIAEAGGRFTAIAEDGAGALAAFAAFTCCLEQLKSEAGT